MPAKVVTGQDAHDVAAYVAESVAEPGKDTGLLAQTGKPAGSGKPAVEKDGTLQIDTDPTGQLAYVTKLGQGTPGKITIKSQNKSSTPHDIVIDGKGQGKVVTNGGVSQFSADFTPAPTRSTARSPATARPACRARSRSSRAARRQTPRAA